MEKRILEYVKMHNMIERGDRIVVGVSGGADSVCLLCLLAKWRRLFDIQLRAVHINHGIRGEAANSDEAFVRGLCESLGVEGEFIHADIPALAEKTGSSEEEAGRNFRYNEFVRICRQYSCNKIAIAHNNNDQTETVLFNIVRGSGIFGLKGILPVSKREEFVLIRPLLNTQRQQIEALLKEWGQPYCTDATNFETEYSRNKLRNIILPMLREQVNAGTDEHLCELARQANDMRLMVEHLTDEAETAVVRVNEPGRLLLDINMLLKLDIPVRENLVRRCIGRITGSLKDITNVHVKNVFDLAGKQVGRRLDLPYDLRASVEYNGLLFEKGKRPDLAQDADGEEYTGRICPRGGTKNSSGEGVNISNGAAVENPCGEGVTIPLPGVITLPNGGTLETEIIRVPDIGKGNRTEIADIDESAVRIDESVFQNNCTKYFDYDKIKGNVVIRTRQSGDYLILKQNGENGKEYGHKSLKSFMTDRKIPRTERDRILLLCEASHVLWVMGERRDDSCFVDESTRRILKITYVAKNGLN